MEIRGKWQNNTLIPFRRHVPELQRVFTEGAIVDAVVENERSAASHKHEFAWLRSAYYNLPEHTAHQFKNAEHLRKFALIKTGFCTRTDHVCKSSAEAERTAAILSRYVDGYAIIVTDGSVVSVFEAMSQSVRSMGASKFQESKQAILEYIAGLLEVQPDELGQAA